MFINFIIEEKGVYDHNLFLSASHAHNVYFGYLVSGGIVIFSIFFPISDSPFSICFDLV